MAYLVTGGTGLIGSHIVRDLVKDGARVVVYDWSPDYGVFERLLGAGERALVKIVQGDVTDLPHLMREVKENGVDVIVHMAAVLSTDVNQNPALAIKINSGGTANVFETARILGLRKVVWASSMSVFGPPEKYREEYIPNDAPHSPWGVYGATKSLNETLAAHYCQQYGMDISAIRYSLVYGPGSARGGAGALTRELMINPALGKPGRVPYGDETIGWHYVDDAAKATMLAIKSGKTKTRAFTVMGELRPVKEAFAYVKSLLPEADITLLPGFSGLSWKFDTKPVETELGYRADWGMERGIREVINRTRVQNGLGPV